LFNKTINTKKTTKIFKAKHVENYRIRKINNNNQIKCFSGIQMKLFILFFSYNNYYYYYYCYYFLLNSYKWIYNINKKIIIKGLILIQNGFNRKWNEIKKQITKRKKVFF